MLRLFCHLFVYRGSTCCIQTNDGLTDLFGVETGVRQGCILSPFLFLIALDFVMRRALDQQHAGIPFGQRQLVDLDFADDIALIGLTLQNLADLTTILENEAARIGLRINSLKTKVMRIGYIRSNIPVIVGQQRIEEVDQFTYLGSVIADDGNAKHHVKCRLGKASAVFQRLRPIWRSSTIALPIKIRLFNSIVIPTAVYACETWKMSAGIVRKLNVFQQRCLRQILRITYRDRVPNEEVHRRTLTCPLAETVAERRFRFAGHIFRLLPNRLPRTAITWTPLQGKRKQGRPRTTWRKTFIDDLKAVDVAWDEAENIATDRARWRSLAAQCALRHRRN
uniref:Reverse transcriptase domain-containing protein n=1 Tax=Plectus sambesii TaxID=2011161 RepID=A0A914VG25_9BILA